MNITLKCSIISLFLILLAASCSVRDLPSSTTTQAIQASTEISGESIPSQEPSTSQTKPSVLIQEDTEEPIADFLVAQATAEQFFNEVCPPRAWNTQWSPSEDWATMSCCASEGHHGYKLVVIHPISQSRWDVNVDELGIPEGEDDPSNQLFPIHWTKDEQYLYFSAGFVTDPGFLFSNGVGLYRLDLTSGDVVRIVGGQMVASRNETQFAFSISPDDHLLYYVQHHEPIGIRILKLDNGDEVFYPLDSIFHRAGRFIWSPDGNSLIFLAATGYRDDLKIHVVIMDVISGDLTVLPMSLDYNVNWLGWESDTRLRLEVDAYPETPVVWILDIIGGELNPVDSEG